MSNYIDAFVFPLAKEHVNEYQKVATSVAEIWKEHGALAYYEYVGDDLTLEGTRSFPEFAQVRENEMVVFGWVVFESKGVRDRANKLVAGDPRIKDLEVPLMDPSRMIFDPKRMVYGGFKSFIKSE